jgi:lysophospholipase L1-like esterase
MSPRLARLGALALSVLLATTLVTGRADAATMPISGTVLSPTGTAAPSICVYVLDATTLAYVTVVATTADGTYSISGLTGSAYKLGFVDCSGHGYATQWYDGAPAAATAQSVAASASGLSTQMKTPAGTIAGTVFGSFGVGAPNICIYAFDATSSAYVTQLATAANGTYSITGLAGAAYKLAFVDCSGRGYLAQWSGGATTMAGATPVPVGAKGVVTSLQATAAITGTVLTPFGAPAENVCIYSFDAVSTAYEAVTVTDAAGRYRLTGPAGSSAKLAFADCSGHGYVSEWYDAATIATATSVRFGTAQLVTTMKDGFERARTAVASRATSPMNMLFVGDSVTSGFFTGTRPQRFTDLVRTQLQGSAPTGIGYEAASGAESDVGGMAYPSLWQRTAATFDNLHGLGRRARVLGTSTSSTTLTVTTDELWLFYSSAPTTGAMRVSIDGTQVALVNTTSAQATGGLHWDSGPLSLGTHTLRVEPVVALDGSVAPIIVEGAQVFAGDQTAGVHEWEAGHAGYGAGSFVDGTTWAGAVPAVHPDLVVIELGINDARGGVSPAQLKDQLSAIVDVVRASSPTASIALLSMWQPVGVTAAGWQRFVVAQRDLAAARGLGFIDMTAATQGMALTGAGGLSDDGIHPNPLGSGVIASTILKSLGAAG